MKKLNFNGNLELLTREQLKNIVGGDGYGGEEGSYCKIISEDGSTYCTHWCDTTCTYSVDGKVVHCGDKSLACPG